MQIWHFPRKISSQKFKFSKILFVCFLKTGCISKLKSRLHLEYRDLFLKIVSQIKTYYLLAHASLKKIIREIFIKHLLCAKH